MDFNIAESISKNDLLKASERFAGMYDRIIKSISIKYAFKAATMKSIWK